MQKALKFSEIIQSYSERKHHVSCAEGNTCQSLIIQNK